MYIRQPDKNRRKKKLLRLKPNHKGFWFYSEGNEETDLDEMIEIKVMPNTTSGGNFISSSLIWFPLGINISKTTKVLGSREKIILLLRI